MTTRTGTPTTIRPLSFFALTFALSWLIWIPLVLSHFHIGPFRVAEETSAAVRLLGVLMPAAAAMLLCAAAGGRAAVRRLLAPLGRWRVGWTWWAAAVLFQPVLLVACGLVYNQLGGRPPVSALPVASAGAMAVNIFFLLLATLGEEIGWRGLALPALQQRHSALRASVVLGLVTATWHIPFWLLLDTFDQFGVGYLVLNYLMILPMTVYITWLFNGGRASLLLPVAFHVSFNIVNVAWMPVTTSVGAFALFVAAQWVIAIVLVWRLEPVPEV